MLAPIYETIRLVKAELPAAVTFLGFCGAPWTVATYMVAGHGTPDQAPARLFAYRHPEAFARLIDILVEASTRLSRSPAQRRCRRCANLRYLGRNSAAGRIQRWCIAPTKRIVADVRRAVPGAKIIGFPRGAGSNLKRYVEDIEIDAVGLDWMVDLDFARDEIQRRRPVQGNLDPLALRAGGAALDRSVDAILAALAGGPFIFNLGHGILPDTPIAHVEQMLKRVRGN